MIFSVIVPFLNEEKYIRQCLDSLLNQDFDKNEYELIFVDNGSTDNSRAIVKQFREINLLYEARRNVYAARNAALKKVKGEIIAFTDADCCVSKDWLTQIYMGLNNNGATIALGEVSFRKDSSIGLQILEQYLNTRIEYIILNGHNRHLYGYTNNMAVKASIFKKIGGFKEWPIPGDTEIIHRCLLSFPDFKIAYLNQMKVVHMEVNNLGEWYIKNFFHCKHNVLVEKYADFAPISLQIRRHIFSFCSKKYNYSFAYQLVYYFITAIGSLFYFAGRWAGKMAFFSGRIQNTKEKISKTN